ncbi:Crp/Fnr family transcriptional regulator [Variovorax sp. WS11]|uniref:Crp/Fnr family transcriptional regulator n=1 Tax=Variovorax sp. WS11 TaxID=1105204 RepID=UPI000D0D02C3|nr:Crp/Fnr family transcriptional regulator [Variovorax sp. WS11]NDZ13332.1 Crp/Fnr family transcriptional regulator [Variovorax sp. WS11]PSL79656.1 Crp/Fnr family transcriptional regulator [Variovorax sp. WS11]
MPLKPAAPRADPLAELPPQIQKLAALGVQRRYRKHAMLIEEGDQGGTVYIVLSGRLRAFVSDARGREVTLGLHGPGEYVGEMSLDGGPRSASVQAMGSTLCAVVTRETMLRHLALDPELARELIIRLIRRARLATESARSMALLDVYSRLRLLLEGRAEAQADGTRVVIERLTHQAIASEIGCSREMVSRLLKDLENGGYLLVQHRTLILQRPLPQRW